mgnify:CR=1 FL=1
MAKFGGLKASAGVSQIASRLDILDASEYVQWRNMVSKQQHIDEGNDVTKWKPSEDPSSHRTHTLLSRHLHR